MNIDLQAVTDRLRDRASTDNDDQLQFSRWELSVILESLASYQELVGQANRFKIADRIYVDLRDEEEDRWAVVSDGWVLDNENTWVREPMPSSRTDEFLERTRYSRTEAIAKAKALNGNHDGR